MALSSPSDRTILAEREAPLASVLLMYAAALVVQITGIMAVGIALDDVAFARVATYVTLAGTTASFFRRAKTSRPAPWDTSVMIVALVSFIGVMYLTQDSALLLPDTAADNSGAYIGVLLCWGVALRSFTLTYTGPLLFSCVPTIALIGVSATQSSDPSLRTVFMTFVVAAVYMLIQAQASTGGEADRARRAVHDRSMMMWQLELAALYAVPAFLLATLLYVPLSTLGPSVMVTPSVNLAAAQRLFGAVGAPTAASAPAQLRVAQGPVHLSDAVVMRVRSREPELWRDATYDRYDGHGWSNTKPFRRLLTSREVQDDYLHVYDIPVDFLDALGPRKSLTQSFTFEGPGQFTEVYAAAEPREVRIASSRMRLDQSGAFHLNYMDRARVYRVDSAVSTAGPDYLRKSRGATPPDILETYARLDNLSPDVFAQLQGVAEQVTAGATNNYDRVIALKDWIAQRCKYNTAAPAAPLDQDVVVSFLFNSREGYCDSFATALAVLCRTLGIPARVATGYVSGDFDPVRGEYLVRDKHRHMWTEVYFPTAGWISFDATEGAVDISPKAPLPGTHRERSLAALLFRRGWGPPLAMLCLIGMLAYVVKVELTDRLARRRRQGAARSDIPATNRAIVAAYERACSALARKGIVRRPFDTPAEYLHIASAYLPDDGRVRAALTALTDAVIRFRYSAEIASPDDVDIALGSLQAVRADMRTVRRRRRSEERLPSTAGA